MKKYFQGFFMAWGMFCSLPCPWRTWNDEARPLMILFLPVVGLIIGVFWMLLGMLMQWLNLPILLMAAILTILPYALTGFLHLDGYMDVSDAVLSRRGLEERQRILKDPHVGSFAVIMVCCLFLINFSLFASADKNIDLRPLLLVPVAVRCCAGAAVSLLRPMQTSQYSGKYRTNVRPSHIAILFILLAITFACSWLLAEWKGLAVSTAGVIVYWLAVLWAKHDLDGMNGDISGFGLVLGELASVAAMVLLGG